MSRTTTPAPLDSPSYWRRLLAVAHPDRNGGDHELFLFLQGVREHVEQCANPVAPLHRSRRRDPSTSRPTEAGGVPYDEALGYVDEHIMLTMRATSIGARSEEPFASVLAQLLDCPSQEHGRPALRQCRGASFKQLAYVAHLVGMSKPQRTRWYDLARTVPLSAAHLHHLINKLKRAGEAAA